jgi:hypothetical protein
MTSAQTLNAGLETGEDACKYAPSQIVPKPLLAFQDHSTNSVLR